MPPRELRCLNAAFSLKGFSLFHDQSSRKQTQSQAKAGKKNPVDGLFSKSVLDLTAVK